MDHRSNTRNVLSAVRRSGLALEFVDEQTPEIIYAALEQNKDAIAFVDKEYILDVVKLSSFMCSVDYKINEAAKLVQKLCHEDIDHAIDCGR